MQKDTLEIIFAKHMSLPYVLHIVAIKNEIF